MTTALRKAYWTRSIKELSAERRPLVEKRFERGFSTWHERILLRHLERELDWYEMALLRPSFEHLEGIIRERRKIARSMQHLARKICAASA